LTSDEKEKESFKILGLEPGANKEAIKDAYKYLGLLHHPDKTNNKDGTLMTELTRARDCLIKRDCT
jgi:curved DNA-binding protein CbpA